MPKFTPTEGISQVFIGTDNFSLAGLSDEAKKTINLLAVRPDLVNEMTYDQEKVWHYCEEFCGKLSEKDLRTLTTLYELFIAPGSVKVLMPGSPTPVESPVNCWVGQD